MENLKETKMLSFSEASGELKGYVSAMLNEENNIRQLNVNITTEGYEDIANINIGNGLDIEETIEKIKAIILQAKSNVEAAYPKN